MRKLINKSCNVKQFAAFIVYLFTCAVLAKLMLRGFGDSPHMREIVGGGGYFSHSYVHLEILFGA